MGFLTSLHCIQIPQPCHEGSRTYEAILLHRPQQSMVFTRCGLPRSHHALAWHQSSGGSIPWGMQLTVAWLRPTRPAIALCCMHSWASASTSCVIPPGDERGIIRTISGNWEKICRCWFELATVWRQIWVNDHLSCSFGLRRSHLALKWKSKQGKVRFLWGAVTFHVNFSPLKA